MCYKFPAQNPEAKYKLPKKNVLLISCIDLRLTDDLVRFMDSDNLTNRYDHFVLAGTSLAYTLEHDANWRNHNHDPEAGRFDVDNFHIAQWTQSLDDHIKIAIALHGIRDVYLVEHENCGAYHGFVAEDKLEKGEKHCQRHCSEALAKHISTNPRYFNIIYGIPTHLNVHTFQMDLRGHVKLLETYPGGTL